MKRITHEQARMRIERRRASGAHVDPRLVGEVESGEIYLHVLENPDEFLNLIWSEFDGIRLLAPKGCARTLRAVGKRLLDTKLGFADLTRPQGMSFADHDPDWFGRCLAIAADFSFEKFGDLALTPATRGEKSQSPEGDFYIYDGTHKSLVLSAMLLTGEIEYQPVEALVLFPRRS